MWIKVLWCRRSSLLRSFFIRGDSLIQMQEDIRAKNDYPCDRTPFHSQSWKSFSWNWNKVSRGNHWFTHVSFTSRCIDVKRGKMYIYFIEWTIALRWHVFTSQVSLVKKKDRMISKWIAESLDRDWNSKVGCPVSQGFWSFDALFETQEKIRSTELPMTRFDPLNQRIEETKGLIRNGKE